MDNIFEINENFDFKILNLYDPVLINNNYFSKITYGKFNKSLYFKLNKCSSKNGIVKTAYKSFCELNYIINENNNILEFFENLEKFCLEKIINNKDKWFYNSDNINSDDIEELLTPSCKSYKYGKNILIKTQILNKKILIYDEEENKVDLEDFDKNSEFIPLIHINGIKFSNRSLFLDIILKQMLLVPFNNDFDNQCLLLNKKQVIQTSLEEENLKQASLKQENLKQASLEEENLKQASLKQASLKQASLKQENLKQASLKQESLKQESLKQESLKQESLEEENLKQESLEEASLKQENLEEENLEEASLKQENLEEENLEEASFEKDLKKQDNLVNIEINDLENSDDETFNIKSRDTIYLEMYKAAKKKAKEIRKNAIKAFIEAKNIKTQYNLDNLVNSDSSEEEDL